MPRRWRAEDCSSTGSAYQMNTGETSLHVSRARNISSVISINPMIVLTVVGVWRAREDASSGVSGSGHARAMRETRKLYMEWKVERLKLFVGDNALHWKIVKWQD